MCVKPAKPHMSAVVGYGQILLILRRDLYPEEICKKGSVTQFLWNVIYQMSVMDFQIMWWP